MFCQNCTNKTNVENRNKAGNLQLKKKTKQFTFIVEQFPNASTLSLALVTHIGLIFIKNTMQKSSGRSQWKQPHHSFESYKIRPIVLGNVFLNATYWHLNY